MRFLADENADSAWIHALVEDDHDVIRVADDPSLDAGSDDIDVLAAASSAGRVLLTADQSDFSDPPLDDHAGIVVVTDLSRSGGEIRRGIRALERDVPEFRGKWRS